MQGHPAPGSKRPTHLKDSSLCQTHGSSSDQQAQPTETEPASKARKKVKRDGFVTVDLSDQNDSGDINHVYDGRRGRSRNTKKDQPRAGSARIEQTSFMPLFCSFHFFCLPHTCMTLAHTSASSFARTTTHHGIEHTHTLSLSLSYTHSVRTFRTLFGMNHRSQGKRGHARSQALFLIIFPVNHNANHF